MKKIIVGNAQHGSIGDLLWLSSIFQFVKGKIILQDDKQNRFIAPLLDGIVDYEFSKNPPLRPDKEKNYDAPVHRIQKIMDCLGIQEHYKIPKLKIKKEEKEWAKEHLKKYINPVIVINDNGGTWDLTNTRAHYVRPPIQNIQIFTNELLSKGYTPLQFGRIEDKYFTPLFSTIQIRGLSIREELACYSIIGKIVSGDTGNYHMMLAVGGKALVSIPEESLEMGYSYSDLLYNKECFLPNEPRVLYFNHGNPEILKYLDFNL